MESYEHAAMRHFADAEDLAARRRLDNAGHLIGLAAECAVKHAVRRTEFLAAVGECLPPGAHPAVTAVPVPYLAYEGLQVEIEGYAMRREDGERTPRAFADTGAGSPLPDPFRQGVRSGRMIFVSAQSPVDATGRVLYPGDDAMMVEIDAFAMKRRESSRNSGCASAPNSGCSRMTARCAGISSPGRCSSSPGDPRR